VILVSHDRAFLSAVVDHVLHVEAGTMTPYAGSYEHFVAQRTERRLVQQRQFDKQGKVIAAQEDYIRRNLAGQNTKQAKGRRKLLARTPRLSPPPGEEDVMSLRLEVAQRGGDQVLVADRATLAVRNPDKTERVLIRDFTARLTRGEVVGFVGPNGAGKSTLLKAVVGEREPLGGGLAARGRLDPGGALPAGHGAGAVRQDALRRHPGPPPHLGAAAGAGHLGRFGFSGDEVLRRADTLSAASGRAWRSR
jgi:ATP-binding cassette subfamily F protein 3